VNECRLGVVLSRGLILFAASASLLGSSGCSTIKHWMAYCRHAAPEPCVLAPDATAEEIVNTLNENVTQLYAWRSTDVKITARQGGMPITLSAVMAVESPRKLRMIVRSFAADEVDLGSNPERFWFWMRRGDPHGILTASYDDVEDGRPMGPIPFQPDWLIEALGVVPFSASEFQMRELSESQPRRVLFVAEQVTPQGKKVQRTMLVDACQGVVLEHSLRESSGRLIARATLSNYQREPSGVRLPHRVDLNWPDSGVDLTMRMGHIEVNPSAISEQTWAMPSYPDAPVIDLTRFRP
jgi:hypothetical protein